MKEEDPDISATPTPQNERDSAPAAKPRRRPLWLRILKWLTATVVIVALLVVLLISAVVWTLTPDRLTPLVNRYASEYLIADVKTSRVELTFWSTFPKFSVEVDSLNIVSRTLSTLSDSVRAELPADADSLLFMRNFSGAINLLKLAKGEIALYDVNISDTRANLLAVNDSVANYLIVPPSPPTPEKEEPITLPDISLERFTIADGLVVRYSSPADSLSCTARVHNMNLADSLTGEPLYTLHFSGDAQAILPPFTVPKTPFFADGKIRWSSKRPLELALSDFAIGAGKVSAIFTGRVDLADTLTVSDFSARIPRFAVTDALALVPEKFAPPLKGLDTDLWLEISAKAAGSFHPLENDLPVIEATLKAGATKVRYDRLNLKKFEADIEARINCPSPDASVVTVRKIAAIGKAMDFKLEGSVAYPISDPLVKGRFEGGITLQNLPSGLLNRLPCVLRGALRGNAAFNTRMSYLTPKLFYRSKIDGEVTVDDFRMVMTDGSLDSYLRHGLLKFGSNSDITVRNVVVDSMLTASVKVDTMALLSQGVGLTGAELNAGVGARNIAASSDTSQINPIGATIRAGRLSLRSDSDSIRVRMRDSRISASLRRYQSDSRSPLLTAVISSASMRYADRFNRASVRDARINLNLHPRRRPEMTSARKARFDSLAALYPTLSTDSIMRMMASRRSDRRQDPDRENLTVELDNNLYSLLRRWQAGGEFTASRIRVFTPYFPTRNSVSDVNLSFSTDSIVLRNTKLKLGNSDFLLNGSLRNITRALLSRRGTPFKLDFSVESDTIDVNNLTATMLRGAVFADKISKGELQQLSEDEEDEELQREISSQLPDTARSAVIIPSNIDARFSLKAKRVLYADLWLHRLNGLVEVFDGAVNLDRLRARTSIGSVDFSALYTAPSVKDLSLAAAVNIRRLNLRSVLDMMPGIDSLLPLLSEVRGIVDADLALVTDLDSMMNLNLNTLDLALKISGDSLQLLDNDTFRTIAKWMMFKNKSVNMIDRMDVEIAVHDGYVDIYPFIFDMDRYRIGVRGGNDASFNLDYHVAVIKSPVPFKFGINIKGTPDKMKIRLGKARINEKTVAESRKITDTARVNLVTEMTDVFRRGVKATGSRGLKLTGTRQGSNRGTAAEEESGDSFTHADSVILIQQGLIEKPQGFIMPGDSATVSIPATNSKRQKKKK